MRFSGQIIGVDESGKGDFFGPLIVAGLLAGDADLEFLDEIGVKDSKRVTDKRCLVIAERLRARFPHKVVVLKPEEYNRRYDKIRNLNILLAQCHAGVIAGLANQVSSRIDFAVSDKFGKNERLESALAATACSLPVKQLVRGEAVPQVAAASILARSEFVRQMDKLSEELQIKLPKGASAHVDEVGRQLVSHHGIDILTSLAKTHFKNYQRATAGDLFPR
ncbi:MAG: ribonuclease HIII [candidate division Zixibacteria bacterium]|nr:ribonuclease HIII [candidate division Zixibacteria bacterium]